MHVYSDPVQNFISFLVADMEATPENPTAFATSLLEQAKCKIAAGKGEIGFLTGSSFAGKNFNREQSLSALDVAFACRHALDLYADTAGASPITFPNFGWL